MLVEPREAPYKKVVAFWLPCPIGHLLSNLSKADKSGIIGSIPPQAAFLRNALRNFWSLNISLDFTTICSRVKEPDFIRALPLFSNNIFRIRTRLKSEWSRLHFDYLGSLFHPTSGIPLSRIELAGNIRKADRSLSRRRIFSLASILRRYITLIPDHVKDFLTRTRPPYESDEIVHYTGDEDKEHYAMYRPDELYELRSDSSGFSNILPDPHDISDWDLDCPVNGIHKVSMWGSKKRNFRPIHGPMSSCFPQDGWWKSPLLPDPFLLSMLSIRRMTGMFSAKSLPPNCESNWEERILLALSTLPAGVLPWRKIWGSVGCFFISPKAEYTWLRYLHRAVYVRSKQSESSTDCRLGCSRSESQLHLPYCGFTRPVRRLVNRLINALGHDKSLIHKDPLFSFGFNLDSSGAIWKDEIVRALYRLYWRIVYKHLTRLELDDTPFFHPVVSKDLCRAFMACILAYQSQRRSFFLSRVHTKRTEVLPRAAAARVASLGELDVHTGGFIVKPTVTTLLSEYEVWSDFNYD